MTLHKIPSIATVLLFSSSLYSDIFQFYDGDNNGSLFLSNSSAIPQASLAFEELFWANLPSVDLTNAYLFQTNLQHANLNNAILDFAYMKDINLANSNMANSTLEYSYAFNANFNSANLVFANFIGATLSFSDFLESDLSFSVFALANISHASFIDATLVGANFTGVCCWGSADFNGATYDNTTIFASGMDPTELGMVFIPAPATLAVYLVFMSIHCLNLRRI